MQRCPLWSKNRLTLTCQFHVFMEEWLVIPQQQSHSTLEKKQNIPAASFHCQLSVSTSIWKEEYGSFS